MTDFRRLVHTLCDGRVEFLIIGGVAAAAHGSSRLTQDLDVVYARHRSNLERLVATVGSLDPYLRGAPPGLPFRWDLETLTRGLNFTLTTALGDLDLLGEIVGGGGYEQLRPQCVELPIFDRRCAVLGLSALLRTKRATGRPRDLLVVAELEALTEEGGEG